MLTGTTRLVVGAPSLVAGAPRCAQVHLKATASGRVNSGISPLCYSGPTTIRHAQRLPVIEIHCADVLCAIIIVLHSFLAQYFEPSIVYISSFPMEITL